MNSVFLKGFPVVKNKTDLTFSPEGKAYFGISICVPYSLSKEKKEELEGKNLPTADFPYIKFFGKPAETVANNLDSIKEIIIQGAKFSTSSYTDGEGNQRYDASIVVNSYEHFSLVFKSRE